MSLSIQEISDRIELQYLAVRYADIIDRRAFAELRDICVADAWIDYREMGGPACCLEDTISFLEDSLSVFANYQHLVSNAQFEVDGDRATGKVMCFNPMEMRVKGGTHTYLLGLWYMDEFLRTADGWRFASRSQKFSWSYNVPANVMNKGT